jgi:hypothetical protein
MRLSMRAAMLLISGMLVTTAGASAQTAATPPPLTLDGQTALWTVSIRPDKIAEFEKVMNKLQEGLLKSQKPERRQQAAGWKVFKVDKPMPDGNIAYVHVINPVVPSANYSVMDILYDEFPDERQSLYEMYRAAFAANLSLATGAVVVDMTKVASTASTR